jgi:hypothetical protein
MNMPKRASRHHAMRASRVADHAAISEASSGGALSAILAAGGAAKHATARKVETMEAA